LSYYDDLQKFKKNINYSTGKYPVRVISGNEILEENQDGEMFQIGYTLDYCSELEDLINASINKAEEYKNLLIEHGIIEKEKIEMELLQERLDEQAKVIKQQSELIQKAVSVIERFENKDGGDVSNECGGNVGISQEDKSEISGKDRKKSRQDKQGSPIVE
jgi:hypothetical protein